MKTSGSRTPGEPGPVEPREATPPPRELEAYPTRAVSGFGSVQATPLDDLYRFRAIFVSPAMREELLHTKLPLAPPEQLLDSRPPTPGPRLRIDRNARTEPSLGIPSSVREDAASVGEARAFQRRQHRHRRLVAALLALLLVLAVVAAFLRWRGRVALDSATRGLAGAARDAR